MKVAEVHPYLTELNEYYAGIRFLKLSNRPGARSHVGLPATHDPEVIIPLCGRGMATLPAPADVNTEVCVGCRMAVFRLHSDTAESPTG